MQLMTDDMHTRLKSCIIEGLSKQKDVDVRERSLHDALRLLELTEEVKIRD